MRNMRSASEPVASARPACVKLPNLSSAAAFAALTSSARASAAPGSSLNPPLYAVCAADPISAAACIAAVRTCSSTRRPLLSSPPSDSSPVLALAFALFLRLSDATPGSSSAVLFVPPALLTVPSGLVHSSGKVRVLCKDL